MSKLQRERLKCPFCPCSRFIRLVHLSWSQNSGTADEPAGLRCADCGADVDVNKMVERQRLDEKRKELEALQAEVGATSPPPKAEPAAGKGKA